MWSLGALPDGEYVKYVLTSKELDILLTTAIIDITKVIMPYGSTALIHNCLFHLYLL